MGFEIPPNESPEGWKFDGEDWVKADEDGIPWVWDGEEYGIKDSETGCAMVERDDGIYLKDHGELIAYEDPETGEWVQIDPEPQTKASPETEEHTTSQPHAAHSEPAPIKPAATKLSLGDDFERSAANLPMMDQYLRRIWCRDDNTLQIRSMLRNPQTFNYEVALTEHIRQIQYICRRILLANHLKGVTAPADQVLCAVAITIIDLFDPAAGEIKQKGTAVLKESLSELLRKDDLHLFRPMQQRAKCLLRNRLQCCLNQ